MRVLRDYMREHPEESFNRAMDQADAGTLVQGEKSPTTPVRLDSDIKIKRYQVKPMSDQAIEGNIRRGNQAAEYHPAGTRQRE